MQGTVEVTDLFRGAFLLCMGGDLAEVRVRNNGKRIATFLITGADLDRLDSDYRAGRALVNPVQLRESLNHLRDVMFDTLRKYDPASPKGYAGIARLRANATPRQEGRRKNGHRSGGNRSSQAY